MASKKQPDTEQLIQRGDANDDGQVTGADLIAVQQSFGKTLGAGDASAPATSDTAVTIIDPRHVCTTHAAA